jgi:hypothetical protein
LTLMTSPKFYTSMLNAHARFMKQRAENTKRKWRPSDRGGAMKILERQIHGHTREQQKRLFPEIGAEN